MMRLCFIGILGGVFMSVAGVCCAQTSGELDLDVRAQTGSGSGLSLYDGSITTQTQLGSSLSFQVEGARIYGEGRFEKALLEQDWGSQRLQVGLVRLPFGVYNTEETYASGLIAYPLVRDQADGCTFDWAVPGAFWQGGSPKLQLEAAAFDGNAVNLWSGSQTMKGAAARAQTYFGDLILGVSNWDSYVDPAPGPWTSRENVHVTGVDMRYTRPHLVLRGEYVVGTMGDDYLSGWYLDSFYRLPKYEKFTFVSRLELLRPSSSSSTVRQLTLGLRYTIAPGWSCAANWRTASGQSESSEYGASDFGNSGTFLFQVYHSIAL